MDQGNGPSFSKTWIKVRVKRFNVYESCLGVKAGWRGTWMRVLLPSVVVKRELSWKAQLIIYLLIHVPTLTFDYMMGIMTQRKRSWIKVTKISFLHWWPGSDLDQVSAQEAFWMTPSEGFMSWSQWKDSGTNPEINRRISLSERPWDPLGSAGECHWGEGCLGFLHGPATSMDQPQINMDRWMDGCRQYLEMNNLCDIVRENLTFTWGCMIVNAMFTVVHVP